MYSKLTDEVVLASPDNYSHGRNGEKICKITPHHMAGVLSGRRCAELFQESGRDASANYCIGVDGDIVCSVEEEDRAWTSYSGWNDRQSITIEVSNNEIGGGWSVSEASWNALVNLCVDICNRYGFRLDYTGDKYGSLTRHNMFVNTNCPGPYLQSRFQELADIVNARLDGGDIPDPTPEPSWDSTIKSIQSWLNDEYGAGLAVDGYYGPKTHKALVKALQHEFNVQLGAGLAEDGIFGPATKSKCPNIRKGMSGNITKLIQCMLYCRGYDPNGIDGIFGSGTESAVKAFQRDNGLSADGIVGKNTFEKLFK